MFTVYNINVYTSLIIKAKKIIYKFLLHVFQEKFLRTVYLWNKNNTYWIDKVICYIGKEKKIKLMLENMCQDLCQR